MTRHHFERGSKAGRPVSTPISHPKWFNLDAIKQEAERLDERGWVEKLRLPPNKKSDEYKLREKNFIDQARRNEIELGFVKKADDQTLKRLHEFSYNPKAWAVTESVSAHIKSFGRCNDPMEAEWVLAAGREIFYFDPRCSDAKLTTLFEKLLSDVRKRHSVTKIKMNLWCANRILALHYLVCADGEYYEPDKIFSFDIGAWLFPDISNSKERAKRLQRTKKVYQEALEALPLLVIEAGNN